MRLALRQLAELDETMAKYVDNGDVESMDPISVVDKRTKWPFMHSEYL